MKLKSIILLVICIFMDSYHVFASDISIFMDDTQIYSDTFPIIENDRVLVPIRCIFEQINALVTWEDGVVTITDSENSIVITIGSNIIMYNGAVKIIDVAARIQYDRTYIPLRAVLELMDCAVIWDGDNQIINIYTQTLTSESDKYNYLYEYEVFVLINEIRRSSGISELVWSDELANVGRLHAEDMYTRKFFNHINPDNQSPFDRMHDYGITYMFAAENIAQGYASPQEAVDGWMNSDAHRENILNPELHTMGVGYYNNYWCQEFTD